MAAITLAQAQLDAYLAAEVAVLGSQSYEITGLTVAPKSHVNTPHHPPAPNVMASHAAETNFDEKEKCFANIIGVEATDVNVKAFKSRCGSCNVKDGPLPLEDHHDPARLRWLLGGAWAMPPETTRPLTGVLEVSRAHPTGLSGV
jgi:hypothetical protein